ncbi:MAG: MFS transporter [Halobacteria archaeon]|nr:MFS transporter [Halobacteria archaeon]
MSIDIPSVFTKEWGLVLGVGMMSTSAAAYEIVPASISPIVIRELSISPTASSFIISVMFGVAVLTSIPIGIGLDHTDIRIATVIAALALVIAGVWGWQAASVESYWSLIGSRVLGGLAYATIWNAGANLVGSSFDIESRATAIGVFTASAPGGFAIGQFMGPFVADYIGWSANFAVFGLLTVMGLVIFLWTSHGLQPAVDISTPRVEDFKRVLTSRNVWYVCAMGFMAFSLYLFLNSWMPTYLDEDLGLSLAQGGSMVALFAAVGVFSRATGGYLSDRLFDTRRRPIVVVSFVVTTPVVAVMAVSRRVLLVLVLLIIAGFFIQLCIGLFFTYIRELVETNVATTAIAALTAANLFGAFISPIIAGVLIEQTGNFLAAFGYAGLVAVIGLGLAWHAPEPNP